MGKMVGVPALSDVDAREIIMGFISEVGDALDRNRVRVRRSAWPDGRYVIYFRKHRITICRGFHSIWIDGIEFREGIEISYFMDAVYEAWMGQQDEAQIQREQKSRARAVKAFNIKYGKLAQSLLGRKKK